MAEATRSIFTEKAQDKLRNPDDLDEYVRVTNPSVWVVLAACAILMIGLFARGFFGTVATSVGAAGTCVKGEVVCFLPFDRASKKASNILKAARVYGLAASCATGNAAALREKGCFPCIIFWNFNHFVVLDGFKGEYAYLNDPARGEVRVTMKEFEESFTGIVLMFEKTEAFQEGGSKPSTLRYARERLAGMGAAIAFVMLTAAITSLTGIVNTSMGQVFMDRILSGDNPEWLGPLMVCMLIMAAVTGIVSVLNALYLVRIRGKIAVVSSSRFMRHLLHLLVGFYAQRMVGDLQQRQSSNETIAFALIGICRNLIMGRVSIKLDIAAESATYARMLSLPAKFFKGYNAGELARRMAGVTTLCQQTVSVLLGPWPVTASPLL